MQTHAKNFVKSVIFNATMWGFVLVLFYVYSMKDKELEISTRMVE